MKTITTKEGLFDWLVQGMEEQAKWMKDHPDELAQIRATIKKLKTQPLVTGSTAHQQPEVPAIIPHKLYKPAEVAVILGVSYDTAVRVMEKMKRSANFSTKRNAKKRLLRVKGSDLLEYIQSKLGA